MQQYKWNTIKIQLLQLIINVLYGSNFMVIFLLFHRWRNKTSRCREVWQLGTRFSGCCRCGEVAVRGSSTVFSKNRHPLKLLFPSFTRKISPRSENDKIPISYSGITTFSLKPAVEWRRLSLKFPPKWRWFTRAQLSIEKISYSQSSSS